MPKSRLTANALVVAALATAGALLATGAPAAAARPLPDPAAPVVPMIVGGKPADQVYPWMTAMFYNGNKVENETCGAVLVAPTWILTAKHCVQRTGVFTVRVGSNDLATSGTTATVASFTSQKGTDLTLGRLDRAVAQQPIALGGDAGGSGTPLRLLGWGGLLADPDVETNQYPSFLQQLDTAVGRPDQCRLGSGYVCVKGAPDTGACFGDSGGPALRRVGGVWTVVGIAYSFVLGEGCGEGATYYTPVAANRRWIENVTGTKVSAPQALVGKASNRCVTASAVGAPVVLSDCTGARGQQWTSIGDGTLRALGGCLDVSAARQFTDIGRTDDGVRVTLADCRDGQFATYLKDGWTPRPDGSLYEFYTRACLDAVKRGTANGTPLQIWSCNPGRDRDNQVFSLR